MVIQDYYRIMVVCDSCLASAVQSCDEREWNPMCLLRLFPMINDFPDREDAVPENLVSRVNNLVIFSDTILDGWIHTTGSLGTKAIFDAPKLRSPKTTVMLFFSVEKFRDWWFEQLKIQLVFDAWTHRKRKHHEELLYWKSRIEY